MSEALDLPIAYIAGVIDCRGHIEINDRHGKQQPRIRITTNRVTLLDWLAVRVGTKVVLDNRGYVRRPCGEHCTDRHSHVVRQSAQLTIDSSRALIVLHNVEPFIVGQRDRVRLALLRGTDHFPPLRGNVPEQMAALGWSLPQAGSPVDDARRGLQ